MYYTLQKELKWFKPIVKWQIVFLSVSQSQGLRLTWRALCVCSGVKLQTCGSPSGWTWRFTADGWTPVRPVSFHACQLVLRVQVSPQADTFPLEVRAVPQVQFLLCCDASLVFPSRISRPRWPHPPRHFFPCHLHELSLSVTGLTIHELMHLCGHYHTDGCLKCNLFIALFDGDNAHTHIEQYKSGTDALHKKCIAIANSQLQSQVGHFYTFKYIIYIFIQPLFR